MSRFDTSRDIARNPIAAHPALGTEVDKLATDSLNRQSSGKSMDENCLPMLMVWKLKTTVHQYKVYYYIH